MMCVLGSSFKVIYHLKSGATNEPQSPQKSYQPSPFLGSRGLADKKITRKEMSGKLKCATLMLPAGIGLVGRSLRVHEHDICSRLGFPF